MEYTHIQRKQVSRLILGCEPLGGTDWGEFDTAQVQAAVRTAWDAGISAYDTANVYGLGLSESRLAESLGDHRRDAYIITKFGVNWTPTHDGTRAPTFRDSSPKHVVEALEASLRRLKVDSVPLYFIHWPDANTPIEDTMRALENLYRAGKIQSVGVSNFSAQQVRRAHAAFPVAAVQAQYNLLERGAETWLIPTCRELGIAVLAYGPLAQGLLTGKFDRDTVFAANDRRSRLPNFQEGNFERNLRAVRRVQRVAEARARTVAQVALRWLLDNFEVSGVIVGAKTPSQLTENLGALDWALSPSEIEYLNQAEDE